VCNLLLGFSSVRQPLLKAGVLQALSPLTTSMLPELRLYAAWAFKNASHEADAEVQQQLLAELSWAGFRALLTGDDDVRVREQAVGLLQNLCKATAGVEQVGGGLQCHFSVGIVQPHSVVLMPTYAVELLQSLCKAGRCALRMQASVQVFALQG
jgi:hypothetical protein